MEQTHEQIALVDHPLEAPIESIHTSHELRIRTGNAGRGQEDTELKESIETHGILKPLIVRQNPDGSYTLITGDRRLAQARGLGYTKVPVLLTKDQLTPFQELSIALEEQIRVKHLEPAERAAAAARLKALYEKLHPEARRGRPSKGNGASSSEGASPRAPAATSVLARSTGTSPRTLQREVRIGERLIPEAAEAFKQGKITKSQAYELSGKPPGEQAKLLETLLIRPKPKPATRIKPNPPSQGPAQISGAAGDAVTMLLELVDQVDTKLMALPDDHAEAIRDPWVRPRLREKVEALIQTCQLLLRRLDGAPEPQPVRRQKIRSNGEQPGRRITP